MTPEIVHFGIAAVFGLLGWWIRHQSATPAPAGPTLPNGVTVPPEIMSALGTFIAHQQAIKGHSALIDLLALAVPAPTLPIAVTVPK